MKTISKKKMTSEYLSSTIPFGSMIKLVDIKDEVLFFGPYNPTIFNVMYKKYASGFCFIKVLDNKGKVLFTELIS
jgi:hypothetical protein